MIHHLSIPALNTVQVANALADIWGVTATPFPLNSDSYMIIPFDEYGTLIEVYPFGTELFAGMGKELKIFVCNSSKSVSIYTSQQVAVSVPASFEEIQAIALREGWKVSQANRNGLFDVVQLWIENQLVLDLLPPDIPPQDLMMMQLQSSQSQLLSVS